MKKFVRILAVVADICTVTMFLYEVFILLGIVAEAVVV